MSRKQNTIKNITVNSLSFVLITALNFFSRKVFLEFFPIEYFGLNSLCTQVLSMLSLAELGIGSAMVYSLYKPIAEENYTVITSLMQLYKKLYQYIAIGVGCLGIIATFFLDKFIKDDIPQHLIYIVFLLYLTNTIFTYLLAYKRSLLYANQKSYIMTSIDTVIKIISLVMQVVSLYIFQSFELFVAITIAFTICGNIYVNYIVNKRYPFINNNESIELPSEYKQEIKKNVKAISLHQIGDFTIKSSDSIILAVFLNLSIVGIYSNYLVLINAITSMLFQIFGATTASIGNLIQSKGAKECYSIFKIIHLINFILVANVVTLFLFLVNPFIDIWLGTKYTLDKFDVGLMSISLYLMYMRFCLSSFKSAGGIYDQDKYLPLLESAAKIIGCSFFIHFWGVKGLFIGHILSSLLIPTWSRPYYVFKYVFKVRLMQYFKESGLFVLLLVGSVLLCAYILNNLKIGTGILGIIINGGIVFGIVNSLIIMVCYKHVGIQYILKHLKVL